MEAKHGETEREQRILNLFREFLAADTGAVPSFAASAGKPERAGRAGTQINREHRHGQED